MNKEISQTASNAPEKFWYFNNGITMVADEAIKAPAGAASKAAGVFSFKGASLVNGAQTVSSLARVENDASLGNIRVSARVILLKSAPLGFGGEVTRTNNYQNRIEPRDFVAQDPEQRRLRQEMAIEGIDYQFVRSDEANATSNAACELLEVTSALACAAGDSSLAVQLKTGIGRLFADLTKAPYKMVFNPSVSGAYAFNATICNREIEAWIEGKKRSVSKKSGPKWGVLVHGNRILAAAVFKQLGAENLSKPISEFPGWLQKSNAKSFCEESYERMVSGIEKHYSGKFLAVLFKNPRMSKHVFDLAVTG